MIPVPSSSSHDRRVVAKKSLRVLTSVKMGCVTAALKLQYALTVTIIGGHVGSNLRLSSWYQGNNSYYYLGGTLVCFRKLPNLKQIWLPPSVKNPNRR